MNKSGSDLLLPTGSDARAGDGGAASPRLLAVSEDERRERQLAALYELWRAVPYTAVDRLLQMLAERATAALDAHTSSLLLRERGGDEMTGAASVGLPQDVADSATLLVGERIAGRVAATGQPVLINDPRTHPLLAGETSEEVSPRPEVESALCAPLLAADGDVLGVLCLSRLAPAAPFTEGDLRVFSLFGAQAGSVIAQVRVGANLARRGQELAALAQVAEAIRARLPEEALLEHLAEGVQEVIGFERCQVWRRQRNPDGACEEWVLAAGRGYLRGAPARSAESLRLPECLRSLQAPALVADVAAEHPEGGAFPSALGVRTGVAAPLLVRDECEAVVLADVGVGKRAVPRGDGGNAGAVRRARVGGAGKRPPVRRAGAGRARGGGDGARDGAHGQSGRAGTTGGDGGAPGARNPLSSIKGAAQFLLTEYVEAEDPTVRDFLSIVVEEVNGLGRLTTDLLEFARLSPPRPGRCDLVAVTRGEVDFQRAELRRQNIEIRESYDAPAWTDLDAAQVGRALRNLLLNAAQAMPQGGASGVSVHAVADPGGGGMYEYGGRRLRARGAGSDPRPPVRAVLHHQGQGDGAGAGPGAPGDRGPQRQHRRGRCAGRRCPVHGAPAGGVTGGTDLTKPAPCVKPKSTL